MVHFVLTGACVEAWGGQQVRGVFYRPAPKSKDPIRVLPNIPTQDPEVINKMPQDFR